MHNALKHSCDRYLPLGNVFQAIVSVMAVKIQFSSPNIVRLSLNCPGTLQKFKVMLTLFNVTKPYFSMRSKVTFGIKLCVFCMTYLNMKNMSVM